MGIGDLSVASTVGVPEANNQIKWGELAPMGVARQLEHHAESGEVMEFIGSMGQYDDRLIGPIV